MIETNEPSRDYLERILDLLSIAIRAIERRQYDNSSLGELVRLAVERTKSIVGSDEKLQKANPNIRLLTPESAHILMERTRGWPDDVRDILLNSAHDAATIFQYGKRGQLPSLRGEFLGAYERIICFRHNLKEILHNSRSPSISSPGIAFDDAFAARKLSESSVNTHANEVAFESRSFDPNSESSPISVQQGSVATETVLELDLIGYSTIAAALEEGLDVEVSSKLNDQIQRRVDTGLKAAGVTRESAVAKTTGDGAIVVFDRPPEAHIFADAVHQATRAHNLRKPLGIGKRIFRVGIATGDLVLPPKQGGGMEIAGMIVTRAVRLEARAAPGEVLCDSDTFAGLTPMQQKSYSPAAKITGKRGEVFTAHRAVLNPEGVADAAFFKDRKASDEPRYRAEPAERE